MIVRLIATAAVVLAIAAPAGQSRDAAQQPSFRASADLVGVDVSVRRAGRPVANLVAADFEVLDNGVKQVVSDLSFGKLPIDVTVALDVSESVTGTVLDQLRRAVRQLVSDLGPNDRLKLMTFNMRVKRVMDFVESATPAATEAAFKAMAGSGSTAVFDSIAVVLAEPATPERRHLLVVFSDGEDSASITDMPTLLELARRTSPTLAVVLSGTGGPVYVSGTGPQTFTARSPNVAQRGNAENYTALARETGGMVVFADLGGDIGGTFRRLLGDFRQSYVLYFSPTGVDRQGWHPLSVRVVRSGTHEVRARSGYEWR